MDALTFIVEITKALAWPLAAVVVALMFRQQLRALLARIRKGKVGFTEFEFEQEVKELVDQTPQQPLSSPSIDRPTIALATNSPRVAVVEAWLNLESAAFKLARKHDINQPRTLSPTSLIRSLDKSGVVNNDEVALFNDLRVLRNQATHDLDFSPSPESVLNYVQLAYTLQKRLENAAER